MKMTGEDCHKECSPQGWLNSSRSAFSLVNGPGGRHSRIEFLISPKVLSKLATFWVRDLMPGPLPVAGDRRPENCDVDLVFVVLLQGPKVRKEIPDANAHLHTVGVGLAVVRCINEINSVD